jgi:hypothetical protein
VANFTIDVFVRRVGALAALLAAAIFLAPVDARASIAADFNGDGVLDRVVLPRPPETNIVVHLSGSAPQVLRLSSRLISIVAVDVDHDGNLDLSALSERRGLLVWLNKAGHGRFAALKKQHVRRGLGFSRGSKTTATSRDYESPAASGDQGGSPDADAPRAGPLFEPPRANDTVPAFHAAPSQAPDNTTAPRGPPPLN